MHTYVRTLQLTISVTCWKFASFVIRRIFFSVVRRWMPTPRLFFFHFPQHACPFVSDVNGCFCCCCCYYQSRALFASIADISTLNFIVFPGTYFTKCDRFESTMFIFTNTYLVRVRESRHFIKYWHPLWWISLNHRKKQYEAVSFSLKPKIDSIVCSLLLTRVLHKSPIKRGDAKTQFDWMVLVFVTLIQFDWGKISQSEIMYRMERNVRTIVSHHLHVDIITHITLRRHHQFLNAFVCTPKTGGYSN